MPTPTGLSIFQIFSVLLTILCCYIFLQILILYELLPITNIYGHSPILLWWTPFMNTTERTIICKGKYKCVISGDRTLKTSLPLSAFLFYGSRIENHDYPIPRNYSIPWAVLHEESPKNYAPFLFPVVQQLFNLTSTFSSKSQFPLTLQYLESLELITDPKYYVPVEIKNKFLGEYSPVLYIQSNCDTPSDRDHIVKELSKYIQIDRYGECLRNRDFPLELTDVPKLDLYNEEYLKFISKYKFTIAIENAVCNDYITEKLWRPLIAGSIPIYHGSYSVRKWLPNNNSAILVEDFDSIASLASFIREVNEDDTLYTLFMVHKILEKISNRYLIKYILNNNPVPAFECFVCEKIYKKDFGTFQENIYDCPMPKQNTKENTWHQHWKIGQCQAKSLANLLAFGKPFTAEDFEKSWLKLLQMGECKD